MAEITVNETGAPGRALTNEARTLPSSLTFERVGKTSEGAKLTNTEAMRLVREVRAWAAQFQHDDARALCDAMDDIERLFVRAWTEIDESLWELAKVSSCKATDLDTESLSRAVYMLNRWQDRGGRFGNAG